MLKASDAACYALRNTTTATLCGIEPGATKIVALNPQYHHSTGINAIAQAIYNQQLIVVDISGSDVPYYRSYGMMGSFQNEVSGFCNDLNDAATIGAHYEKALRLHWNLSAQHALMDMIGQDVLSTDFTNLGVTKAATISKMEPIYALVMQGMFTEAATLTAALATDDFFTTAKIAQYQAIIAGADAFAVVL